MPRDHDIVVHGASGFVGKLTAAYLAGAAPAGTRLALSGRSAQRLEGVREELGVHWPVIVADSHDRDALERLAASATVVATTVGPYAQYGVPLVEACAAAGTHYADLAGEVTFMRRSIDVAHERAQATGARIVHTCGFDSIPSDLSVHALAAAAAGVALGETTFVVRAARGGFSGGTAASMKGLVDEARRDPATRRLLLDLYALSPDRAAEPDLGERDPARPRHDDALGGWLAPFVMGAVNSRVVRRSNALRGHAYGRELRYSEWMRTGGGPLGAAGAVALTAGLGATVAALAFPPTRLLLDRLLPDPGDGPSEDARERGFFRIDVHSELADGRRLVCEVEAPGDPGYKATAVMFGESALALAGDGLPDAAGVLTPATAIGDALLARLRAAGHRYDVTG